MNNAPLVSICCVTYNHAPFIRQCLDGFLMQKGVNYEILIHDDCSTDGTTEIVKEYAAKYPDLIFPIYETENQFCKPGRESMDFYNYRRARGKYIATCEGDDYWTDPLKLQKQVDFMEANLEYSVCFTGFTNHVVQTDEYLDSTTNVLLRTFSDVDGMDIDLSCYFNGWYTQQLTMLFRMSKFRYEWSKQYKNYRDTHEIYHLIKAGKCRLMNFNCGVYNIHKGGISSCISPLQSCGEVHKYITDLYLHNRQDRELRKYLTNALLWILEVYYKREKKSLYWTTVKDILHDTPELFPYVMWIQLKRAIKN